MARRVLADFDAELLLRLSNRNDITAGQRGFFIQDAARWIANQIDDPALQGLADETLAQNSDTLTLVVATDLWWHVMLKSVTDGGNPLEPDDKERIEVNLTKPVGPPRRFYWFNSKFYFDSLADTAKTIRVWYKKNPAEFVTSPVTDKMYDPLIIMKAAKLGFETVRDFDEATKMQGLIRIYATENNIPIDMGKLNDYNQGVKVRLG